MDVAQGVIERYYGTADGELCIGGVPVGALAGTYGTPFFAYDRSVVDRKLGLLREALPERFSISYSVKANPNPWIVRHFVERGCGLEVASAGEFRLALGAGCRADRIIMAGPGKTEAELELVVSQGIGEVHAESLVEIARLGAITRRLGRTARVGLRVNGAEDVQGGAMRMGGKPSPFGVDEERLDEALAAVLAQPSLAFCGIHLYMGTQITDETVLARQYRHGVEVARRAARIAGRALDTLDFGGGLGIPYFPGERELDMLKLGEQVGALVLELEGDPAFRTTRFMVEPGRYLVGEAGVYVARVNDIKVSRGKKFLVLDGGMNHHLAASGNLGQVIKRNFPPAILNRLSPAATERVDVVGPLCTPLDTLGRDATLPVAELGDLVGVFQSGAYGRSASPLGFLSHPAPAEIWVDDGQASLVTPRGDLSGT
jgi:diaminopimelate decarboxylase